MKAIRGMTARCTGRILEVPTGPELLGKDGGSLTFQ